MIPDKIKTKNGFTLIETLMAIAIFGILWGIMSAFIITLYRSQEHSMDQAVAVDEARRAADIMAKEIRQARDADNGAYPLEKCGGKEFIFYGDVDGDGAVERVRYFLAMVQSGTETGSCTAVNTGSACSVLFDNFLLSGETLKFAEVKVSTRGRYGSYFGGSSARFSEFSVDGGAKLADICRYSADSCTNCSVSWQGLKTFDVTDAARDGSILFTLDGSDSVTKSCSWNSFSMKANFDFFWTKEIPNVDHELKRGITDPAAGNPVSYPPANEQITGISSFVRNAPPVFTYYDKNGIEIGENDPNILVNTRAVGLNMIIDVKPEKSPNSYELRQTVQIRNLKD
jgi:prepilin-type N-terminal cleavage/methylation domain-containing protein